MPILHSLPLPEMEHIVRKSQADRIICCETLKARGGELAASTGSAQPPPRLHQAWRYSLLADCLSSYIHRVKLVIPIPLKFESSGSPLPTISSDAFDLDRQAFMLFTSGSTGQPKGVPITHAALASQCASMSEVWGWSSKDRILHVVSLVEHPPKYSRLPIDRVSFSWLPYAAPYASYVTSTFELDPGGADLS